MSLAAKIGALFAGAFLNPAVVPRLSGSVVQVQNFQTGASSASAGVVNIPGDDTLPQSNEGTEFMTLAITPTDASNVLLIEVVINLGGSASSSGTVALFKDADANALAASYCIFGGADYTSCVVVRHKMTAGGTSPITFKVRAGAGSTLTMNGWAATRKFGGAMASSITITEIAA